MCRLNEKAKESSYCTKFELLFLAFLPTTTYCLTLGL